MPEENSDSAKKFALVNLNIDLGKFSKPAEKLIDLVRRGLGLAYEPRHIKRTASAYAEAERILQSTNEQTKELYIRSLNRLFSQESRRQKNIEAITQSAVQELPEEVDEKPVDEDWMAHFFERCKDVSDRDMQALWARLLAGEVSKPGTYSLRTLNVVQTLDKIEAELFTKYCGFVCQFDNGGRLRLCSREADLFLKNEGLHAGALQHLEDINLIRLGKFALQFQNKEGEITISYFGKVLTMRKPTAEDRWQIPLRAGAYDTLTGIGHELFPISGAVPNWDYLECLVDSLDKEGFKASFV